MALTGLRVGRFFQARPFSRQRCRVRKVVHKVLSREWVRNSSERQVLVDNFPLTGLPPDTALETGLARPAM